MTEINKENLLAHVLEELTKLCGMKIEPNASVLINGLLDSIGLMELIVSVQNKFNLTVDLEDLKREEFDTPQLMTEFFLKNRR